MMESLPNVKQIELVIRDIEEIVFNIYSDNMQGAQAKLDITFQAISIYYNYMIAGAERYRTLGVEIPVEILCQHVSNMNDAAEHNDLLQLTDTMLYEIREGLLYLIELIKQESGMV